MPFDPQKPYNDLPLLPPPVELETRAVLKKAIAAKNKQNAIMSAGTACFEHMSEKRKISDMFLIYVETGDIWVKKRNIYHRWRYGHGLDRLEPGPRAIKRKLLKGIPHD